MKSSTVLVVGSANMDLVATLGQFPRPGETVLARSFATYPGGKGANQAVACAKLGGRVRFLARMGNDAFRGALLESLVRDGVETDHVLIDDEAPTGVALITVDEAGENEIVVASGSNGRLTPQDVTAHQALIADAAVVLLQLEVPLETVMRAAALARAAGATVVLNPAPAQPLPDALLQHIDVLTPNETEAEALTGIVVRDVASAEEAARCLMQRGVRAVVVTLGARGALLVTPEGAEHVPGYPVRAVDTTAAGDAFSGALSGVLAAGHALHEAVPFANLVAAYAVTRPGAQASMPTRADLDGFAAQHGDGDGQAAVLAHILG